MNNTALLAPFFRPIQSLMADPQVTEIMVVEDGRRVFTEVRGRLALTTATFPRHALVDTIQALANHVGVRVTESDPLLEAMLPDGSRVAVAVPPCSVGGATMTIRRFTRRYALAELVAAGSLSAEEAARLAADVRARKNILIAGGTGSGKTTLLNALTAAINPDERSVIIEDMSEIYFGQDSDGDRPHVVRLQTLRDQRAVHLDDQQRAVSISDLLRHALRQRPDRLIVGEIRGAEAFDLLQALNSGHQGTMSTLHANSAQHGVTRFAHLLMAAGAGLPLDTARQAVVDVVDRVVYIARQNGTRKVMQILDLEGARS